MGPIVGGGFSLFLGDAKMFSDRGDVKLIDGNFLLARLLSANLRTRHEAAPLSSDPAGIFYRRMVVEQVFGKLAFVLREWKRKRSMRSAFTIARSSPAFVQ